MKKNQYLFNIMTKSMLCCVGASYGFIKKYGPGLCLEFKKLAVGLPHSFNLWCIDVALFLNSHIYVHYWCNHSILSSEGELTLRQKEWIIVELRLCLGNFGVDTMFLHSSEYLGWHVYIFLLGIVKLRTSWSWNPIVHNMSFSG